MPMDWFSSLAHVLPFPSLLSLVSPRLTRTHRPGQADHDNKTRPSAGSTRRPHHHKAQNAGPAACRKAPIATTTTHHHDQHARKAKTHRRRRQRQQRQQRHWQPSGRHARPTVASQGHSTTLEHPTRTLGTRPGPAGALHPPRPVDHGPAVAAASGRARRGHGPRARLGRFV